MHNTSDGHSAPIQIIVMPGSDGELQPAWIKSLPLLEADPPPIESRALSPLRSEFDDLLRFAQSVNTKHGLLFLRCGLELPEYWRQRLCATVEESASLPRLPAGNYADDVNPIAGLNEFTAAEDIDGWMWLCGENSATPIEQFPLDCLYFPPETVGSLNDETPALLLDSLFVRDSRRPLTGGRMDDQACASALGLTRHRLQALSEERSLPKPQPIGLDSRPVTLHISHHWGGGVARWIEDIVNHDKTGHHLVLSACGDPNGKKHGQYLRLYSAGPERACIRQIPLTPVIADTVATDSRYQRLLEAVLERFRGQTFHGGAQA